MAKVPNRDQFYTSRRTGTTARRTGGEVVEISFQIPAGRVVEVVKETCPVQWRIHDELEHGFPDVLPNRQLGQLLVQVVDAIDEETRHANPAILPGTAPDCVYSSEDFTHDEAPTVEAAPPVSPTEFDPCPELSDAERPSGVITHAQELEEAHQERVELLQKIEDLTRQRDAARAEAKRHASVISSTVDERKEERARLDNLIKADEDRAFHQRQKIEATRKGEVAALLITELTGILCTKEMDGDERERVWKEFYRRLTVQTEDHPTRLTTAVRDIAHKLFRSAIKRS